ncbi:TPA: lanthionine synthetase C family protein [Staphylococcus argenteus]|uniref:lanthionine synthetase C family protein n=1 Tax=Staphylococcus argenteus TaxID=985002 RepID=UPI0005014BE7|nr:lanthionine synthetase C family protein [Staphylococcus argenteus]MBE2136009.1 lanthionine synthetase C family protein [Staphylococcus argenteus]MDT3006617.1 lanthionine synthetase C family protein [Staphylococcus argenteus]UPO20067.1 lanthionine synthetase C family protein [Staphylococcus argenteus]CDR65079.1 Epidermin biosynthesis protein epiC [Staphylococcus argenteus]HDY9447112.1 lanthionine synthetase C family protein [Staphylococcus argenteus]
MTDLNLILKKKFQEVSEVDDFISKVATETDYFEPSTLSHGIPGIILFLDAYQKVFDINTEQIVYKFVMKLAPYLQNGQYNNSLFGGLSGIAFSMDIASQNGRNYQKILNNIDDVIVNEIESDINQILQEPLNPLNYDSISGLAGIGRYLLNRIDVSDKNVKALKSILTYFKNIQYSQNSWVVPQESQFLESDKNYFTQGNINLGLAHGVLGPMSLFALCMIKGITIENHQQILKDMYKYIMDEKFSSNDRWLQRYDLISERNHFNYIRNGWCYGNTGVMTTLFLIGQALQDDEIIQMSKKVMLQVVNDKEKNLISPTVCHGLSSQILMLTNMNLHFELNEVSDYINELINKLMSHYKEDHLVNFIDINENNEGVFKSEKVGLLEGEIGVYLTLMTLQNTNILNEKNWTNAFLIS